jgi:glycosyltransferase involved in cell wall biosynthesis
VEKFYIYDNESTDDTREVLEPYIKAGIVEYKYWPGQAQQLIAYKDWLRYRFDTKWLAVIDLDEFIVPIETKTIPEFLKKLPRGSSQLLIGWTFYGSNGHKKRPVGLVIENYTKRGKKSWLFKAIVKTKNVKDILVHRHGCYGFTVDENFEKDPSWANENTEAPKKKIRINHYHCKSWEEYSKKAARGCVYHGTEHGMTRYIRSFFDDHDMSDILDPVMDKYVEPVKRAIKSRPKPV